LSRWVYTIDYVAGRLFLADDGPGDGERGVRVPLSRTAGGLVVRVGQPGGTRALHLVPDSGADRLVLFRTACAALPSMTLLDTVRVRSVTGEAMARLIRLEDLQIAGIRLGARQGLLLEGRPPDGAMGDGLLPLHLFARVTFHVAASYLLLEPRR
jgi:hypothetical protein